MSIELSRIIFSCFEAFLYIFCVNVILPKTSRVDFKYSFLQFVIITISSYLFLIDNVISILLFHSILILIIYLINKVDVYIASISVIITFLNMLVASLVSIIFAIFIYGKQYDFRFVLDGNEYRVYLLKFIVAITCIYTYKIFNSLFNRKIKVQKIDPRPVVFVNTIVFVILIYFSCILIEYIPSIYSDIIKINDLDNLLSTGIFTAYIASIFMLYIINIYLFKSSDYLSIKLSSEIDSMTGVLNRKAGINFLKERMKSVQAKKSVLTVCFIDVNNLKDVNDTYGHKEGDELITSLANVINGALRDDDNIARLGGDEFLVIFDQCHINQAIKAWERILERIDLINISSRFEHNISVSVGFTEYNYNMNLSHDLLIELADAEMYKNKERYKRLKGKSKW